MARLPLRQAQGQVLPCYLQALKRLKALAKDSHVKIERYEQR